MGILRELGGHPAGTMQATLGLVAHDAKKDELCRFAAAHRRSFETFRLLAPEDTARALREVGVEAQQLARDDRGGDLQLASAVVEGRVDAVFFFADPMMPLAGEPDIRTMLKVCDLERVPLATNLAAAEIVLHHLTGLRRPAAEESEETPRSSELGRVIRLAVPRRGGDNGRGKVQP